MHFHVGGAKNQSHILGSIKTKSGLCVKVGHELVGLADGILTEKVYIVLSLSLYFQALWQERRGDIADGGPIVLKTCVALQSGISGLVAFFEFAFFNFYLRGFKIEVFDVYSFELRIDIGIKAEQDLVLLERLFSGGGEFQVFNFCCIGCDSIGAFFGSEGKSGCCGAGELHILRE